MNWFFWHSRDNSWQPLYSIYISSSNVADNQVCPYPGTSLAILIAIVLWRANTLTGRLAEKLGYRSGTRRSPVTGRIEQYQRNPLVVGLMGANINRMTIDNIKSAGWQIKVDRKLSLDIVRWIEAEPWIIVTAMRHGKKKVIASSNYKKAEPIVCQAVY